VQVDQRNFELPLMKHIEVDINCVKGWKSLIFFCDSIWFASLIKAGVTWNWSEVQEF
jgi:hypothetical protein